MLLAFIAVRRKGRELVFLGCLIEQNPKDNLDLVEIWVLNWFVELITAFVRAYVLLFRLPHVESISFNHNKRL